MNIDLNNKKFKASSNSSIGEVTGDTVFHYHQEKDLIWAEYSGGNIKKGFLVGKIKNDTFMEFVYQHINNSMEMMTGICESKTNFNDSGKIVLNETWQWTCKDFSKGESKLVEI
ncbi:MAG: n-acetylglutamate synthase [Bacteroidetes bacterium]|nr:n-acetylglutamate synthase [Bacteroidota bacterium]